MVARMAPGKGFLKPVWRLVAGELAKNFTSVSFLVCSFGASGPGQGPDRNPVRLMDRRKAGLSEPHSKSVHSLRAEAGRVAGYGLSWLLTMLLFGWGGLELDRRLGTVPLLLILGILIGFAAGLTTIYMRVVAEPASRARGRDAPQAAEEGQ